MTAFLFIISFLLHIVSIGAIYILSKQNSAPIKTDTSEVVALMESYLEEIKEENRILQEKLQFNETDSLTKKVKGAAENKPANNSVETTDIILPTQDTVQDQLEVSLQSQILNLHQEGLSSEEIARRLACGKTEVELILKFHEKDNNNA